MRKAPSLLRRCGLLAAACASLPGWSQAAPNRDVAVIAAPRAYVDFCFREPGECPGSVTERASSSAGTPIANGAAAAYWRLVFEAAEPSGAVSNPVAPLVAAGPPPPLGSDRAQLVVEINARINRAITERSDQETYGARDYWALPMAGSGPRHGDCEDFVLEKRRALYAVGVPAQDMSIALVRTAWGRNHAVLLVSTGSGELMLDNLAPRVQPWRRASYTLIARQQRGHPEIWLGNVTGGPAIR